MSIGSIQILLMGPKKRNPTPRRKENQAMGTIQQTDGGGSAAGATDVQTNIKSQGSIESKGSDLSAIKAEWDRATTALHRGNQSKALKLMKELCHRYEKSGHSAMVHRAQSSVCAEAAAILDDPNAKQKQMKSAIESARKAVELSPNSIEFVYFYANLLYTMAEFEIALRECNRGLAIENPIDPAEESLQEMLTVEQVQNELRQLIHKSTFASLSTWLNNLGIGIERYGVREEPMWAHARRLNESKRATKTPEEIAAARLKEHRL